MLESSITMCQTTVDVSQIYSEKKFTTIEIHSPSTLKVTLDCGVQASLINPQSESNQDQDSLIKKRQKRKEYKRRKKMKMQIMQKENQNEFKSIIDMFYEKSAKFEDYSDRLEQLVCSFNQTEFKKNFDAILKQRIIIIQNSIWQYKKALLDDNPSQIKYDSPFYSKMVHYIYQYYRLIEKSSEQAEHVIYIYLTLNSKNAGQPATQDLGRRTFRFLIQTDTSLKNLLHKCDLNIPLIRFHERQKLQIIINKLKNFRLRRDQNQQTKEQFNEAIESQSEDEDQDSNEYRKMYYEEESVDFDQADDDDQYVQGKIKRHPMMQDEKSTAISENTEEFEDQSKQTKKRRRKNKADNNDCHQTSHEEALFRRLEKLEINQDARKSMRFSCEFENYLKAKIHNSKHRNPEFRVFEQLKAKLMKEMQLQPFSKKLKKQLELQ